LDNIGDKLYSDKIDFLAKYHEFRQLVTRQDYPGVAAIILNLLKTKLAPRRFWPELLLATVPFLESKVVVFNVEDTYLLMNCLEELCLSHRKSEFSYLLGQLETIRYSLTRNLAKALVSK